jgi:hypothetical protein
MARQGIARAFLNTGAGIEESKNRARRGMAWTGAASLGMAALGEARPGKSRQGEGNTENRKSNLPVFFIPKRLDRIKANLIFFSLPGRHASPVARHPPLVVIPGGVCIRRPAFSGDDHD